MVNTYRLKGVIVENGKTQKDIAEAIGVDKSTFYRKMKEGSSFTIGEVNKLIKVIPLADNEIKEIFLFDESQ